MKKGILMLLAAVLLGSANVFAQSGNSEPLKGDVNGDGIVDVADINAIIKIMKDGGGTEIVGDCFYFGTTKPTVANYKTLPGVIYTYTSIGEAFGATATVAAGETIYMLCPTAWMQGINVAIELADGNVINFSDEIDVTTVSGYTIYKTQPLSTSSTAKLRSTITIAKGKLADKAASYEIESEVEYVADGESAKGFVSEDRKIKIDKFSILDGGQLSVTYTENADATGTLWKNGGKTKVVVFDGVEVNEVGGKTVASVIIDNVEVAHIEVAQMADISRALNEFNLTIEGKTVSTHGNPVECAVVDAYTIGGSNLDYLCNKFKVTYMILELEGDVNAYCRFNSANLHSIYEYANRCGAGLTAEDKENFSKTISYVSIGRSAEFNIVYDNGDVDSGDWMWSHQYKQLELWLKDKGMGCKFIPENAKVYVEFNGNSCALTIHAEIKGSKNYSSDLTLIMDAVQ